MIPGGYYIKARIIQNSEIAHSPPHFREIWDWLIKEANHEDKKIHGRVIKRGQCFTTYKEIRDGLSWRIGYRIQRYSKTQCENAMKFLRSRGMITTARTTRGVIVTVCNYDKYQDQKNYESRNECRSDYRSSPQQPDTINKNVSTRTKEYIPPLAGGLSESAAADPDVAAAEEDPKPPKPPKIPPCPHQKIIDLYHEILPELSRVQVWTETAKGWLRARWREKPERQTLAWWENFFKEKIRKSDFLMGRKKDFRADLAWFVKSENFAKIMNGRYRDHGPNTGSARTDQNILVAQRWAEKKMKAGINEREVPNAT